ncbi:MAG: carbonic anhydrase [Planctomycetales bacterium]
MRNLVEGIHRFRTEVFEQHKLLFEQLSGGQAPSTLFITCSDSRIVPNLFTQTGPGELFTLRNAGNIVPPYGASTGGEAATIEYAVSVLGVEHIIVCGHSGCGAITALMEPEAVSDLLAILAWLHQAETTRRIVLENYPDLRGEARLNVAVQENVLVQLENLETHPSVRARLGRGRLTLHAWVYKIETGQVFALSAEARRFVPLSDAMDAGASGRVGQNGIVSHDLGPTESVAT